MQEYLSPKEFWKILRLKISCGIFESKWFTFSDTLFASLFYEYIFAVLSVLYTQKISIVCEDGHFSLNYNELCFYPWKCFVCSVVLADSCSDWHVYRCSLLVGLKADDVLQTDKGEEEKCSALQV